MGEEPRGLSALTPLPPPLLPSCPPAVALVSSQKHPRNYPHCPFPSAQAQHFSEARNNPTRAVYFLCPLILSAAYQGFGPFNAQPGTRSPFYGRYSPVTRRAQHVLHQLVSNQRQDETPWCVTGPHSSAQAAPGNAAAEGYGTKSGLFGQMANGNASKGKRRPEDKTPRGLQRGWLL